MLLDEHDDDRRFSGEVIEAEHFIGCALGNALPEVVVPDDEEVPGLSVTSRGGELAGTQNTVEALLADRLIGVSADAATVQDETHDFIWGEGV